MINISIWDIDKNPIAPFQKTSVNCWIIPMQISSTEAEILKSAQNKLGTTTKFLTQQSLKLLLQSKKILNQLKPSSN